MSKLKTAPKLSVLVLAYNHEKFIHACLSSILTIRKANFEIVMLDDGSPDRTAEIAEAFAKTANVPVRVVRQENTGKTAANAQKLIDISDGAYLMLIAGDDMLGPAFPADTAVSRLEANARLGFVLPRHLQLDEDPILDTPHAYDPGFVHILRSGSPNCILTEHLYRRVSRIFLQGMVIRRSLVEDSGGFEVDFLADDYAFVFRLFNELKRQNGSFWFNEEAFWVYRTHASNIHKNSLRQMLLIMQVAAKYVPPEKWSRFDWSISALDTFEEFEKVRSEAISRFGDDIGAIITKRVGRLSVRRARDSGNAETLRQFVRASTLPPSLTKRARRYYWQLRAKHFRRWLSHDLLYFLATTGVKPATSLVKRRGVSLRELSSVPEQATQSIRLASACIQTTVSPDFGTPETKKVHGKFPQLNAYLMQDAIASPETTQLICNGKLVATAYQKRLRNRIPSNCLDLGFYNQKYALIKKTESTCIEKAILIGGDGAVNWYHFLIEIAPKAYLASLLPASFDDYPLIVPKCVRLAESYGEILKILLPNRVVLTVDRPTVAVKNLVVFDDVTLGPFNLYPDLWPQISDYSQHDEILRDVFAKLRQGLLLSDQRHAKNRRLFIVRPAIRRDYNQQELLNVARKYGFEAFSPEKLNLSEQARMFSEASHVIGSSGAAWSNMVFSAEPIKALTWIYSEYSEFCVYSSLSNLLGHEMRFVEAVPGQKLRSTHEANIANYNVPVDQFENALKKLIA